MDTILQLGFIWSLEGDKICALAMTGLKGMVWSRVGPCDRKAGIDDIARLFFL